MFARIERKLIDRGQIRRAVDVQQVAKVVTLLFPPSWNRMYHQLMWVYDSMMLDFEGMDLILAEVAGTQDVRRLEELQKLNGSLTTEETAKLALARRQISVNEQKWWSYIGRYYTHLYKKPKGCYVRQLDLRRNGYYLYAPEEAQIACRSLGGCCAYSCNCCYRDRCSSRMPGVLMHCVRNCVCCSQRRPPGCAREITWSAAMRALVTDYYCRNRIRY